MIRKGHQHWASLLPPADASLSLPAPGPWFWYGTLGLILINAGVGLMIESGLLKGYPKERRS